MVKKLYWAFIILVGFCGLGALSYFAAQPRPVQKIKISQFESPVMMAQSLLDGLRKEITNSEILILGVELADPESIPVWQEFIRLNQNPQMKYSVVVWDTQLPLDESAELALSALEVSIERINTLQDSDRLIFGLENAALQKQRVLIVVPSEYSSQVIQNNLVNKVKTKFPKVMSLTMSDFPRSRELEKNMTRKCASSTLDTTGLGPFACLVLQTARSVYLKSFTPGKRVGLVNQIDGNDYLVLYTTQPQ